MRGTSDFTRLIGRIVTEYRYMSFSDFSSQLLNLIVLNPQTGPSDDVFIHILGYVTNSLFSFPYISIPIIGLLLGYLFYTTLFLIFEEYKYNSSIFFVLILSAGFLYSYYAYNSINFFRTGLAFWWMALFVVKYVKTQNKVYVFIACLSYLFHFTFVIYSLILVCIVFLPNIFITKISLLVVLFVVSSLSALNFSLDVILDSFGVFGERSGLITGSQSSLFQRISINQSQQLYIALLWPLRVILPYIIVIVLTVKGDYFYKMSFASSLLFSFATLILITANLFSFIPSYSGRALSMTLTFYFLSYLMYYMNLDKEKNKLMKKKNMNNLRYHKIVIFILCFMMIPVYLSELSRLMDVMNIFYVMFPVAGYVFFEYHISIKEFIIELILAR